MERLIPELHFIYVVKMNLDLSIEIFISCYKALRYTRLIVGVNALSSGVPLHSDQLISSITPTVFLVGLLTVFGYSKRQNSMFQALNVK